MIQALVACSRTKEVLGITPQLGKILTPLKKDMWQKELRNHPDKWLTKLLVEGIENGFRIGYDATSRTLKSAPSNMISVMEHPDIVSSYLAKEVKAGRIISVGHWASIVILSGSYQRAENKNSGGS